MGKGKGGKGPSPNDQRSNAMNPNNASQQASQDNRSSQRNQNNPEYKGSSEDESVSGHQEFP